MGANKTWDPLHGVTLESIIEALVKRHGWAGLGQRVPVRCFLYEPSVKSSLAFLRATPWARKKVEDWYVREQQRPSAALAAEAEVCITSVAGTLLALLGVKEGLAASASAPDARVLALAPAGGVKKILVYAPDAIGRRMVTVRPELFAGINAAGFKRVDMRSVFPAKTPVCFASMFSGLTPAGHGIKQYEKPELKCKTVFNALPAAGLKAAIVAVKDSSIDLIFRGRPADYFSEVNDAGVTARALELIEAGAHDFILAYHQEYDDLLHETGPWKEGALAAAKRHAEAFLELAAAFDRKWAGVPRGVLFAPDHGAHVDPDTGKGVHGDNIPADMDLAHFWRFNS
jgi:uncharacterized protein (DUF2132 family)